MSSRRPEEIKKRNGVPNYTKFVEDLFPNESAFPVKEDHLKKYLIYLIRKVKADNLQASSLKQYISNIRAYNRSLKFGWTFDIITKEALDSLERVCNNSVSPNLGNSQSEQSDSSVINFTDSSTDIDDYNINNVHESATPNDARPYLPPEINAPEIIPLPTGIDFYTQPQSEQYNTPVNIPYNLSSLDAQSFSLPNISTNLSNISLNQLPNPTHIESVKQIVDVLGPISNAHRKMMYIVYNLLYAQTSILPDTSANPQNIFSNNLSNSHIDEQELARQMVDVWEQISEAHEKIYNIFNLQR
ncbi:10739_t:CDS:1 [Dentiscutata erythropus]|uniref:10739_t:CDS:1 n=1 Tax=Dentiscutata erythropus TaxID=1348616 RepID=A0A9N9NB90_9GLOM|nr:10739_t:CDS:1 [Dentiscutata erythropus]